MLRREFSQTVEGMSAAISDQVTREAQRVIDQGKIGEQAPAAQ